MCLDLPVDYPSLSKYKKEPNPMVAVGLWSYPLGVARGSCAKAVFEPLASL